MNEFSIRICKVDGRKKPPYTPYDVIDSETWNIKETSYKRALAKANEIARRHRGNWIIFKPDEIKL